MTTYTQKQVRLAVVALVLQLVGGVAIIRAAVTAVVNIAAFLS